METMYKREEMPTQCMRGKPTQEAKESPAAA